MKKYMFLENNNDYEDDLYQIQSTLDYVDIENEKSEFEIVNNIQGENVRKHLERAVSNKMIICSNSVFTPNFGTDSGHQLYLALLFMGRNYVRDVTYLNANDYIIRCLEVYLRNESNVNNLRQLIRAIDSNDLLYMDWEDENPSIKRIKIDGSKHGFITSENFDHLKLMR